ncbi:hypothetical protein L2E82_45310 [Cichorium intybus]|uniref:Uncharacterized protein n=3 Tax=Cichorium intybus TaxID=13427 RepID=A0ACB8ZRR1_CICIN|nr:hypothetical protein L2E82_45284 [Cichorium intybus]KAI3700664.1 hypothetical protein L2E82_45301 [Cichorium intybus]KAI3700673.1 hypothetical protein L2E82_45310 [Cichorium intybus]
MQHAYFVFYFVSFLVLFDLHKFGGLALVIQGLSNSDPGIRVACAWIVGKASQNNPIVQKQVLLTVKNLLMLKSTEFLVVE